MVEPKQRTVTDAAEMTVVGVFLLRATGCADIAVDVEHDRRLRLACTPSIQIPNRSANAIRFAASVCLSVSTCTTSCTGTSAAYHDAPDRAHDY